MLKPDRLEIGGWYPRLPGQGWNTHPSPRPSETTVRSAKPLHLSRAAYPAVRFRRVPGTPAALQWHSLPAQALQALPGLTICRPVPGVPRPPPRWPRPSGQSDSPPPWKGSDTERPNAAAHRPRRCTSSAGSSSPPPGPEPALPIVRHGLFRRLVIRPRRPLQIDPPQCPPGRPGPRHTSFPGHSFYRASPCFSPGALFPAPGPAGSRTPAVKIHAPQLAAGIAVISIDSGFFAALKRIGQVPLHRLAVPINIPHNMPAPQVSRLRRL